MVGIVVVSHSAKLAQAAVEFLSEMKTTDFPLLVAAGINDGQDFGSDPMFIAEQIKKADLGAGVLIICDLGSSVMNAQMAIEFLPLDWQKKVKIANAPFIEGLLAGIVANTESSTLKSLTEEVESVKMIPKF